jgi:hypothetical protein
VGLAVLVAVLVLACAAGPATAGEAPSASGARAWSDAQLRAAEARLDREGQRVGSRLIVAEEQRIDAGRTRDAAHRMLAEWLAETYRDDASHATVAAVLTGGSLRDVGERVQLARALTRYQSGLVDTLDEAEARLDIGAFERARLIQRLTASQRELQVVRAEQSRRAGVVAAQRDRRQRDAAAARAAAAAPTPGALVGASPLATLGLGVAPGTPFATGSATPQSIDAYLASKGSPMAGNGAAFVTSGARYHIDPRLLVAIAGAESNFGAITCGPHNGWGWACPNDPEDFATWAHGIETVTRGLRIGYLNEGRTSVVLIQQKYAPSGAANDPTGLNNHWVANVTKFLVEQGGSPTVVGAGPMAPPPLPDLGGLGILAPR